LNDKRKVSDNIVSEFRTICEVHREIYDLVIESKISDGLANDIIDKLNEAYIMGKKMDNKLRQYKFNYNDKWLKKNQNFDESFKKRNARDKKK